MTLDSSIPHKAEELSVKHAGCARTRHRLARQTENFGDEREGKRHKCIVVRQHVSVTSNSKGRISLPAAALVQYADKAGHLPGRQIAASIVSASRALVSCFYGCSEQNFFSRAQRLLVRALMKLFSPAADSQTCRNHARQYPVGDRSPLGCGCAFCSKLRQTRTKRRPAVRLKCLSRACKLAQAVGLQPFCKRRSIYRYDSKCSTRTHEIMRTQAA